MEEEDEKLTELRIFSDYKMNHSFNPALIANSTADNKTDKTSTDVPTEDISIDEEIENL